MGNSLTIVFVSGEERSLTAKDLWENSIKDVPEEVAVGYIRDALRGILTGVFFGVNVKPDYIFLKCSIERAEKLSELLSKDQFVGSLGITLINGENKGRYAGIYSTDTGIELYPFAPKFTSQLYTCQTCHLEYCKECMFYVDEDASSNRCRECIVVTALLRKVRVCNTEGCSNERGYTITVASGRTSDPVGFIFQI